MFYSFGKTSDSIVSTLLWFNLLYMYLFCGCDGILSFLSFFFGFGQSQEKEVSFFIYTAKMP